MSTAVTIEEVFRRAEQGVLRPFLCKGSDAVTYFVKGRGAGSRDLIAEYVCARLGTFLGLPIPPFSVVEVPRELVAESQMAGIQELGHGPAFGSARVEFAQELSTSTIVKVPKELQAQVLLFDWWILNEDRHYTELGGNPNLLWNYEAGELVVFDHNLAFDEEFRIDSFLESHVFSERATTISNPDFRAWEAARLNAALEHLDAIFSELPQAWCEGAPDFDIDAVAAILKRHHSPDFWNFHRP
jgi:hypothetical protein